MTTFELTRLACEPFLMPLHRQVRHKLIEMSREHGGEARILDVGGRKSHYTIAVPARIHISDIERRSDVQQRLHLGINKAIAQQTARRRSNVKWVLFDDMTSSSIRSETFDFVVAVEVLEHVEKDSEFVAEVSRILRPGGSFLMTTPNGDFVPNHNPDHRRHYHRADLEALLRKHFAEADVQYAIQGGRYRRWGLKPWSLKHPGRTLLSMAGNIINGIESSKPELARTAKGTHHLFAIARKAVS